MRLAGVAVRVFGWLSGVGMLPSRLSSLPFRKFDYLLLCFLIRVYSPANYGVRVCDLFTNTYAMPFVDVKKIK